MRRLAASPLLTAAAVLSLALGLGANATVFSWVRGALIDPLPPAVDTDGLHVLAATGPGELTGALALPELQAIRQGAPSLAAIAAHFTTDVQLAADGDRPPERVLGALVSGDYFQALDVRIPIGRAFLPEEDTAPRARPVAVISHDLWRRRFDSNPAVADTGITVNGERYTIVGVAPDRFWGTAVGVDTSIWIPLAMHEAFVQRDLRGAREARLLQCLARLAPGAPEARARDELATVAAALAENDPAAPTDGTRASQAGRSFTLMAFWRAPAGAQAVLRPMLVPMAVLSALLFGLACINVAQVQLARAQARERTAAVQLALGATPGRLVRETLAEAAMLAGLAAAAALAVAAWSAQLLVRIVPAADFTPRFNVAIDLRVVALAAALAALAAALVAIVPARWASRADVVQALRQEAGTLAGSRRSGRLTAALVVAQVALAVAILTGAGLLLRSLQQYQAGDLGFDPHEVLVARYNLLPSRYPPEAGREFHRQLLDRLRTAPGVEGATIARWIPLSLGGAGTTSIGVPAYLPSPGEEVRVRLNIVGPSYFTTMGIPVLRGRDFDARDVPTGRRVAAVSQSAAERFWPGRDPVGEPITFAGERFEVVAVAGNAPRLLVIDVPDPCVYIPVLQVYRGDMILHVRGTNGRVPPLSLVREALDSLDPDLPLTDPRTLDDHVRDAGFRQRVGAALFGLFGAIAALLGGLGIYALLSHYVAERTRELALRVALGAEPARLRRLVLRRSLSLAAAGVVAGLALAIWGARFLTSLLIGVTPADPLTLVVVPALALLTAVAGALAPLARLRKLDPAALLRG
jgi:putative ABC transport system permease protein